MDEEDGRPGPGARQSGPNDVLPDASMKSLCHPHFFFYTPAIDFAPHGARNRKTPPREAEGNWPHRRWQGETP